MTFEVKRVWTGVQIPPPPPIKDKGGVLDSTDERIGKSRVVRVDAKTTLK